MAHEAWRGERRHRVTPRNEVLLPAICRSLAKHPKKTSRDSPAGRSAASPLNRTPLRATGIALQARASPSPAKLEAPCFPPDLCEKQLLATGTVGSL